MTKPRPPLVRLCELTPGQSGDFFVYLAEKHAGATREGKPFFTCRFRDGSRLATAMIWADTPWFAACEKDWQEGQFFKVRGKYQEHATYGPQIDLANIRPVTPDDEQAGFDPLMLVERSRFNPGEMFAELCRLVETQVRDVPLRRLVLTLLERHAATLQRVPATSRHFHPFAGGLLEHILSVTHTCIYLADKYAKLYGSGGEDGHAETSGGDALDRDVIVAGAVLHDLGRCLEWGPSLTKPERTVEGRLLGHVLLGRDLLRDAAREFADVDPERLRLLEHLIVSHLHHPEWGSARLPMRPEVLIIHHADDLDAKMEMFMRCLRRDQEPGPMTARDPALGKQLYKGVRRGGGRGDEGETP